MSTQLNPPISRKQPRKQSGWRIKVRRYLPISRETAWHFLTSPQGIAVWLGEEADIEFKDGAVYQLANGTCGKIAQCVPYSHLMIVHTAVDGTPTAQIQVHLQSRGDHTLCSFHEHHIPDETARDERGQFYLRVLDAIERAAG
jgi:uncharacterized protein YndB with AHSA1/START domain